MNQNRFERLMRTFATIPSRRNVLRGLAGAGLGLGSLRLTEVADAKKKHKRKHKKKRKTPQPVFNQYGCAEVGQPCYGDNSLCCSGICEGAAPTKKGQPDTRRCAAHDTGTCQQDGPSFCTDSTNPLIACNNAGNKNCLCLRTTAGSNFCGWLEGESTYAACRQDADCVALGLPAGSACIPFWEGACSGASETGMGCFVPCPFASPV